MIIKISDGGEVLNIMSFSKDEIDEITPPSKITLVDSNLNLTSGFDYQTLTRRELKGFNFELDVQNILSNLGYSYEGNPISQDDWKRNNISHKVDIILYNGLRIECKNIDGKVFRSWFVRDWKSKGSCIYTYRGDLKLSNSILTEFHPIVFHWFLLPVYLNYNIPLFRAGVTSLYKLYNSNSYVLDSFSNKNYNLNCEERQKMKPTAKSDMENTSKINDSIDVLLSKKSSSVLTTFNTIKNNIKEIIKKIIKVIDRKSHAFDGGEEIHKPSHKKTKTKTKDTKQQIRVCPACGRTFLSYGLRVKTKYFCRDCEDKSENTIYEELLRRFEKTGIRLKCERCSKLFQVGDRFVKTHGRYFCMDCSKVLWFDVPDSNEEITYNFVTPHGSTIEVTESV